MHHVHLAGGHQEGEGDVGEELDELGAYHQAVAVESIGHHAPHQGAGQDRYPLEHGVEAEKGRRVGQLEHQPARRDNLHPGADVGGELADPEQPEGRVAERREAGAAGACRGDGAVAPPSGRGRGPPRVLPLTHLCACLHALLRAAAGLEGGSPHHGFASGVPRPPVHGAPGSGVCGPPA